MERRSNVQQRATIAGRAGEDRSPPKQNKR